MELKSKLIDWLKKSLIENLQRNDVDPMDVAEGLKKWIDTAPVTGATKRQLVSKLSKLIGLSESKVWEYLSLVELIPEVQEIVSGGKLGVKLASEMYKVFEEKKEFLQMKDD